MKNIEDGTQVTFYYVNGEIESFSFPVSPEVFYQQLQAAAESNWLLCMHLYDRSVMLSLDKVIKIEVAPPFTEVEGHGIFPKTKLITAMMRAARH